ncbi:STAS domain-containing protein [Streptomyces sp. NPDC088752]|uniref:STAS domain-containing protein n=1 Tax=Streptomyces sp. NPDC088752 TaxID=3154963 RepID=UPI00342E210F
MDDAAGSASRELRITHTVHPGAYLLTLSGTADSHTTDGLEDDFAYATAYGPRLVVDLSGLIHGDETLLGLLLHARRFNDVELVGPLTPAFQRRLDTTSVTTWFTIRPTLTTEGPSGRGGGGQDGVVDVVVLDVDAVRAAPHLPDEPADRLGRRDTLLPDYRGTCGGNQDEGRRVSMYGYGEGVSRGEGRRPEDVVAHRPGG